MRRQTLYQMEGCPAGDCVLRRDWDNDLAMTTVQRPTTKIAVLGVADLAAPQATNARLMLPAGVRPFQPNWPYIVVIGAYHVAALLASCRAVSA